jgi:hypothetical protein
VVVRKYLVLLPKIGNRGLDWRRAQAYIRFFSSDSRDPVTTPDGTQKMAIKGPRGVLLVSAKCEFNHPWAGPTPVNLTSRPSRIPNDIRELLS